VDGDLARARRIYYDGILPLVDLMFQNHNRGDPGTTAEGQRLERGVRVAADDLDAIAAPPLYGVHPPAVGCALLDVPSSPVSRGLDTHRDGHSVFVFQVAGSKRWRIWPRASVPLDHRPRTGFTYRQRPQDYRGTTAGGHIMDMRDQPPEIDLTLETG
jgi:hypothetical protein